MNRVRPSLLVARLLALVVFVTSSSALAQRTSAIEALDREALDAYHQLDVDGAIARLDRAIAQSESAPAALRARLHVHRGVVAASGSRDRNRAIDEFRQAIAIDPQAAIEPELNTPEASSAFETARRSPARTPPTVATTVTPQTTAAAPESSEAPAEAASEPTSTGRVVGDACGSSSECGDGLECIDGVCAQDEDGFVEPRSAPRFFFDYGYGVGAGLARSNMEADSTIPYDPAFKPATWNETVNGPYAPPGYTEAQWANQIQATYGGYIAPGTSPGVSPVAYSESCDVATGHYCVRVSSGAIAPTGGLRFSFGYWFTSRVGASLEWRFNTRAGSGQFGRVLATARGHIRVVQPDEDHTGFSMDVIGGLGFGQIQLRPDQGHYVGPPICETGAVANGQRCDDPTANPMPSAAYVQEGDALKRPWIQTGPISLQAGITATYHFTRGFGVFGRPTAYVLLPAFTIVGELAFGAEISF